MFFVVLLLISIVSFNILLGMYFKRTGLLINELFELRREIKRLINNQVNSNNNVVHLFDLIEQTYYSKDYEDKEENLDGAI